MEKVNEIKQEVDSLDSQILELQILIKELQDSCEHVQAKDVGSPTLR